MAAARDRSRALQAIAELRNLQSLGREMEAVRAANAHRAAAERHEASLDALAGVEAGWAETLQGAAFAPDMASQWAAAFAEGEAEARRLEADTEGALKQRERDHEAWQASLGRTEAARGQARAAAKRAERQRDEARLAALEDRGTAERARR